MIENIKIAEIQITELKKVKSRSFLGMLSQMPVQGLQAERLYEESADIQH